MVEILKEKKIRRDIVIPNKLITPETIFDIYNPEIYSDFSRTQIRNSFPFDLGLQILKDYLGKREYNNIIKKMLPLSKNALIFLFREKLNFESQKLKTMYSSFNGVDIDIVKETAKNVKLNPYFKEAVGDIRDYNNLDDGDYIPMSFLSRDLKPSIEYYVELNKEFNSLRIHIDDIFANEMDQKNNRLTGDPRIHIKSSNKYDLLEGFQEIKPDKSIVYITDNDEKTLKGLDYIIRVQKCFGI